MDEKKTNVFQIGMVGAFIALGILGIIVFASIRAENSTQTAIIISMWGTLDKNIVDELIKVLEGTYPDAPRVTYSQRDPRYFYQDVVEALATGQGPDLLMVDQSTMESYFDKILPIPFESFPERTFLDAFVDGASIFVSPKAIIAVPFMLDPMVMYWNKDTFASAGIALPPKYWDELFPLTEKLTTINDSATIVRSAVALGEYTNVTNAKSILSTLMIQAGSPIVAWGAAGPTPALNAKFSYPVVPAYAALVFYTEFSNPLRKAYSWNRSLKSSRDAFLAGELAMYFGHASEFRSLRDSNPNLNFDMAAIPQARTSQRRMTYAAVTGLAIPKASRNPGAAFSVAQMMAGPEVISSLSQMTNLPPIRRDLVSIPQTNAYGSILYDAAIISRSWLEPSPVAVDRIFGRMIDQITSGRADIGTALTGAQTDLVAAFGR